MLSSPEKKRRASQGFRSARPGFSFFRPRDFVQIRSIAILTTLCMLALLLLRSIDPQELPSNPRHVLDSLSLAKLRSTSQDAGIPRIKKLSGVIGDKNDIYEAALRTHERHNAIHGYDMEILRERIIGNYWEKPVYILSKIIEELSKPPSQRNHWIMWCDPDTIVLNPQIPLDVFLPPSDMNRTMFIGSHDDMGLNTGAFFLRVDEWSVNLLVETLALVRVEPKMDLGIDKARTAMQSVLTGMAFRDRTVFMPRWWFNAFERRVSGLEGSKGGMMVHFYGLEGDKWPLMMRYLRKVRSRHNPYEMDFADTAYHHEISEYWDRIRQAKQALRDAKGRKEDTIRELSGRLYHALSFEADKEDTFNGAIDKLANTLVREKW